MSAIHGLASVPITGLGHLVGGDTKGAGKYFGKEVGYSALLGAGSALTLAANRLDTFSKVSFVVAPKLGKIGKFISKNPKAFAIAGGVMALAGGIGCVVNKVKCIADASKIDKKAEKAE